MYRPENKWQIRAVELAYLPLGDNSRYSTKQTDIALARKDGVHMTIKCSYCHQLKPILAKGMCRRCYNNSRKKPCESCGKTKLIYARGLCSNCYHKLGVNSHVVICSDCGKKRSHYAKGLCKSCYNKLQTNEWRKSHPVEFRKRMSRYQRTKRLKSRGD